MSWLLDLSHQYRQRRDIMVRACDEHLPLDICEWTVPAAGMFLWIRIKTAQLGNQPVFKEIEERTCGNLEERGIMVGRGSWFWVGDGGLKELCLRLTFAAAPREKLEEAIRIFGEVLRLQFGHEH
jgi:aromatic amino acid aminotransferase I